MLDAIQHRPAPVGRLPARDRGRDIRRIKELFCALLQRFDDVALRLWTHGRSVAGKISNMHKRSVTLGIMLAGAIALAPAQWLNQRDARIPRTKDGKPNLSAPAPRAANGKPDLSGIWMTEKTPRPEMERLFGFMAGFDVPGDDPLEF